MIVVTVNTSEKYTVVTNKNTFGWSQTRENVYLICHYRLLVAPKDKKEGQISQPNY